MIYNLLFYIQTLFNQRLVYIVRENNSDSQKLSVLDKGSMYIPLFIWLPLIYFFNDEYIYKEYDKYYFIERDTKINISPPIDKIIIYNNRMFNNYEELDITYINEKYSHNIPFWIIVNLENLKDKIFIYNSEIVIEKMGFIRNSKKTKKYEDIYMKPLYQIYQ